MIEGVKIVLPNSRFPQDLRISFVSDREINLCEEGLVFWPVDIHIDEKGAVATLRMTITELEIDGIKANIENVEP